MGYPLPTGGLTNQLVISRIVPNTEALAPIAARFTLLHRPTMGRVVPRPQPEGADSSSSAALASSSGTSRGAPGPRKSVPPGEVAGTAPSAEVTGQEQVEEAHEPPLAPRAVSIVSSSQPTFTPPGSETAGAEAGTFEEETPDIPTTEQLPVETSQLEPLINRQQSVNNVQTTPTEAELQTGTAASRGEVSDAQASSLGPNNTEEFTFNAFALLDPP